MASVVGTSRLDTPALSVKAGHWAQSELLAISPPPKPYPTQLVLALGKICSQMNLLGFFLLTSQRFLLQFVVWAQTPKPLLQRILLVSSSTLPALWSLMLPFCSMMPLSIFSRGFEECFTNTWPSMLKKYPSCLSVFQIIYHDW